MKRKTVLLIGLGVVLVAWLVLLTLQGMRDEELFARQMLEIVEVQVITDASGGDVEDGLERSIEEALAPRVRYLADCLKTDTGTRAPAVIEAVLGPDGPQQVRFRARPALEASVVSCLDDAVSPVPWPAVSRADLTAVILLAPLADDDDDDAAEDELPP